MSDVTPPERPGPASIRDVARAAGVSHQTVSRVLNGHSTIRAETRERVEAAMAALHYRPNAAARALSRNRTRTIGVLVASGSHFGPARALEAVEAAARAHGYFVAAAVVPRQGDDAVRETLNALLAQDVEGLVVIGAQRPVFDRIVASAPRLPFVSLTSAGASDSAMPNGADRHGARLAVRHLAEAGHTRIGHLAGPPTWLEARERAAGVADELAALGLPDPVVVEGDWTVDSGWRVGHRVLPEAACSAWFCANDETAIGFLHAARDLGIAVPGDISVVGYDDVPLAAHVAPPLTTVRQDFEALGRRCVALLLGDAPVPDALPGLTLRASTAPLVARG